MASSTQTASTVLMVRPVDFAFNAETAVDNEFQHVKHDVTGTALKEFEQSVQILRDEGVDVLVLEKSADHDDVHRTKTPDAVFPNNWFGTSRDGKIIVYTMANANRKAEAKRIEDVISLLEQSGYEHDPLPLVLEQYTPEPLEGTGALVIDHIGGVVYAAKSPRCVPSALDKFMELRSNLFSSALLFETKSSTGKEFYHTNVMLSIGTKFAVVCSESIVEQPESSHCVSRQKVLEQLANGRTVIDITLEQAEKFFCANILELRGGSDKSEPKIVMSESAFNGFTEEQRSILAQFGKIVALPITDAIEYVGGGSARCCLAEVFLNKL